MSFFPSSVPTVLDLLTAKNNQSVTLAAAIGSGDTTIPVDSTAALPAKGYVTFEDDTFEVVYYASKTPTALMGCVRGADGTGASSHANGVTIGMWQNAAYHNILADELNAVTQNLASRIGLSASQVLIASGSALTPSLALANYPDTGFYEYLADAIGVTINGTHLGYFDSTGMKLAAGRRIGIGAAVLPVSSGNSSTSESITIGGGTSLGQTGALELVGSKSSVNTDVGRISFINNFLGGADDRLGQIEVALMDADNRGNMIFRTWNGVAQQYLMFNDDYLAATPTINLGDPAYRWGTVYATSIDVSGGFSLGTLLLDDGTQSAPSLSYTLDPNSGMFRIGNDSIGWATGGLLRMAISNAGYVGIGTATPYSQAEVYTATNDLVTHLMTLTNLGSSAIAPAGAGLAFDIATDNFAARAHGAGLIVRRADGAFIFNNTEDRNPAQASAQSIQFRQVGQHPIQFYTDGILRSEITGYSPVWHIYGSETLEGVGFEPFLTMTDSNTSKGVRIKSVNGATILQSNFSGSWVDHLTIANNGDISALGEFVGAGVSWPLLAPSGTITDPSFAWSNQPDLGFCSPAAGYMALVYRGTEKIGFMGGATAADDGVAFLDTVGWVSFDRNGDETNPSIYFGTTGAVGLFVRGASDVLGFSIGGTEVVAISSGKLTVAGDLETNSGLFPSTYGTAGYILSTDGAGALSWIAPSTGGVTYPLLADDGTAGAPSYSWANAPTEGFYRVANKVNLAMNGVGTFSFFNEPSRYPKFGIGTDAPTFALDINVPNDNTLEEVEAIRITNRRFSDGYQFSGSMIQLRQATNDLGAIGDAARIDRFYDGRLRILNQGAVHAAHTADYTTSLEGSAGAVKVGFSSGNHWLAIDQNGRIGLDENPVLAPKGTGLTADHILSWGKTTSDKKALIEMVGNKSAGVFGTLAFVNNTTVDAKIEASRLGVNDSSLLLQVLDGGTGFGITIDGSGTFPGVMPLTDMTVALGLIANRFSQVNAGATRQTYAHIMNAAWNGAISFGAAASVTGNNMYLWPVDGTSGQVLSTDGAGNLSWTTVALSWPALAPQGSELAPSYAFADEPGTGMWISTGDGILAFSQNGRQIGYMTALDDSPQNGLRTFRLTHISNEFQFNLDQTGLAEITADSFGTSNRLYIHHDASARIGSTNSMLNFIPNYAEFTGLGFRPAGSAPLGDATHYWGGAYASLVYTRGLQLMDLDKSNYVEHKAADIIAANQTYTWPVSGTVGQILSTNGAGVLSWVTPTSGSGTVNEGAANHLTFYPGLGTTVDEVDGLWWEFGSLYVGNGYGFRFQQTQDYVMQGVDGQNALAIYNISDTAGTKVGSYYDQFNLTTGLGTANPKVYLKMAYPGGIELGGLGNAAMYFNTMGAMNDSAFHQVITARNSEGAGNNYLGLGYVSNGTGVAHGRIYAPIGNLQLVGANSVSIQGSVWPTGLGTVGQVLTTNGSGTLSWGTPSGGAVTVNTGQANYFAMYTATNVIDEVLVGMDANNNVMNAYRGFWANLNQTNVPTQPAFGWWNNSGSKGIYSSAANEIGITTSSVQRINIADTHFDLKGGIGFRIYETDNTNFMAFLAPTLSADLTFTWPTGYGTNGQFLMTDGAGGLSWATASGGGLTLPLADKTQITWTAPNGPYWLKYDSDFKAFVFHTDNQGSSSGQLAFTHQMGLYSNTDDDGNGNWEPYIEMTQSGKFQMVNTSTGAEADRVLDFVLDKGVSAVGFNSMMNFLRGYGDLRLEIGYDSDGAAVTGSRIRGAKLSVEITDVNFSQRIWSNDSYQSLVIDSIGGSNLVTQIGTTRPSLDIYADMDDAWAPYISLRHLGGAHEIWLASDTVTMLKLTNTLGEFPAQIKGSFGTTPNGFGTAGQVLSTDGAGNLSWATAGGGVTWPLTATDYLNMQGNEIKFNDKTKISWATNKYIKFDSDFGGFVFESNQTNHDAVMCAPNTFGFYANCATDGQGWWEPFFEMIAEGKVNILNQHQGNAIDRYLHICFDQDITTNGFNSIIKLTRTYQTGDNFLELGYDSDGLALTGSRIRGQNLVIESLSPLTFIASEVIMPNAPVKIPTGQPLVLGNSDNAYLKYSADHGTWLGASTIGGNGSALEIAAVTDLGLYGGTAADGSGIWSPFVYLDGSTGKLLFRFQDGSDNALTIENLDGFGAGFHPAIKFGAVNHLNIGYVANGTTTSASRIASTIGHLELTGDTSVKIMNDLWPTTSGTAGQFLQTDGNGILSWATGGGGGVSWPLTATNYLNMDTFDIRWTGTDLMQPWTMKWSSDHNAILFGDNSAPGQKNLQFVAERAMYLYGMTGADGSGPWIGMSFEPESWIYVLSNDSNNFASARFGVIVNKGVVAGDYYNFEIQRTDAGGELPFIKMGYHANGTAPDQSIIYSRLPLRIDVAGNEVGRFDANGLKLPDGSTLAPSMVFSETGSGLSYDAGSHRMEFNILGNPRFWVYDDGAHVGNSKGFFMHTGVAEIQFQAKAAAGAATYYWPEDGTNGQVLTTDGAGNLSWTSAGGGGVTWPLLATGGTESAPSYSFDGLATSGMWATDLGQNGGIQFMFSIDGLARVGVMIQGIRVPDGSAATPSVTFNNNNASGLFLNGSGWPAISDDGVEVAYFAQEYVTVKSPLMVAYNGAQNAGSVGLGTDTGVMFWTEVSSGGQWQDSFIVGTMSDNDSFVYEKMRVDHRGLKLINGTVSAPSYSFTNQPGIGMFADGGSLAMAGGGNVLMYITDGEVSVEDGNILGLYREGTVTAPTLSFGYNMGFFSGYDTAPFLAITTPNFDISAQSEVMRFSHEKVALTDAQLVLATDYSAAIAFADNPHTGWHSGNTLAKQWVFQVDPTGDGQSNFDAIEIGATQFVVKELAFVIDGNTTGFFLQSSAGAGQYWLKAPNGLAQDLSFSFPTDGPTDGYVLAANGTGGETHWVAMGGGGVTWPLLANDGVSTAPSYSFANYTADGLFHDAAGMKIVQNGVNYIAFRENVGGGKSVVDLANGAVTNVALLMDYLSVGFDDASNAYSGIFGDPVAAAFVGISAEGFEVARFVQGGIDVRTNDVRFKNAALTGQMSAKFWEGTGVFGIGTAGLAIYKDADPFLMFDYNYLASGAARIWAPDGKGMELMVNTGGYFWIGATNDDTGIELVHGGYLTLYGQAGMSFKLDNGADNFTFATNNAIRVTVNANGIAMGSGTNISFQDGQGLSWDLGLGIVVDTQNGQFNFKNAGGGAYVNGDLGLYLNGDPVENTGAITILSATGGGYVEIQATDGTNATISRFTATTTANETAMLLYDVNHGSPQRVTVGGLNSGGTGYRLLRIPN